MCGLYVMQQCEASVETRGVSATTKLGSMHKLQFDQVVLKALCNDFLHECYGLPDRTVRRALGAGLSGMSRCHVLSEVNAPVMWGGLSHLYYDRLPITDTVVGRV
jgi:hypothetical protein